MNCFALVSLLLCSLVTVETETNRGPETPPEDGKHFQGDIVYNGNKEDLRSAVTSKDRLWPKDSNGHVILPYVYHTNEPSVKHGVEGAALMLAEKTCVRVVPRTTETNYLRIVRGNGCYSSLGNQQSGPQDLSVGNKCENRVITMHEMIHALGFLHEQMRQDRDDYVTIVENNLAPGGHAQMAKCSQCNAQNLPYDYESVMHYGDEYFTKQPGLKTIIPRRHGVKIGQRERLSHWDVVKINKLYNCDSSKINDDTKFTRSDGCPNGWEKVGSHCYLDTWKEMTYQEAKAYCQQQNAELPMITNQLNLVERYMKDYALPGLVLGMQKSGDTWKLDDGTEARQFNWAYASGGTGPCAYISWSQHKWYSMDCNAKKQRAVCAAKIGGGSGGGSGGGGGGSGGGGGGDCNDRMDCGTMKDLCNQPSHYKSLQYWCPRTCNHC